MVFVLCNCNKDFSEANFGGFMKKKRPRSNDEEEEKEEVVLIIHF